MSISFFRTPQSVIATQADHRLSPEELDKLAWLYGNAELIQAEALEGYFIGPRREMITPWSTNAVEITQNMALTGIRRIEEYFPVDSPEAEYDEMLQRRYNGLDQHIFDVNIEPAPIINIDDLDAYNEQEGLALSPEEIEYLHDVERQLGRKLTDSEVFGFAQINSEHCRHKIFGGTFIIDGKEMPSSLFAMIKRTTQENPHHIISAYKDNVAFAQGPVVEQFAPAEHATSDYFRVKEIESVISIKAETHNFPTTVEPFNGASTGTGGEIRDRMGGGTGSWPIAGTAVYMTSYPRNDELRMTNDESTANDTNSSFVNRHSSSVTRHSPSMERLFEPSASFVTRHSLKERPWLYQTPEQILIKASNGASDFGNKFGQPLIAGSVLTFEHQENGEQYGYDKVIMLAGGVGYGTRRDCLKGTPEKGNKIVVVGGDNYRIGLGGGSVSSVDTGRYSSGIELNAVQRANPEMQKRAYNLIRSLCEEDVNPVVSIHDHGSAGHVNCLSELVEECGGLIDMSKLPIGDPTLSAKEIIANESQERMGLLIQEEHLDHVRAIAERERAPLYVVGQTTGDAHFAFEQADGRRPFDLDVAQMFGHSPKTVMVDDSVERRYEDVPTTNDELQMTNDEYKSPAQAEGKSHSSLVTRHSSLEEALERVLSLEAVACKDWLTNKVDRSVTGKIARQQCQGPLQLPLSDCGVVALDYRGRAGIATALGHAPQAGLADPAAGSVLSVAESLTNIVWAPLTEGLDSVSLSANWMWPCRSQQGEDARLYRAVEALSDFCCALEINVPTGKDSLSMTQKYPDGTKVIAPGTVIVSSGAEVSDVRKVVSPVLADEPRSALYHIDFSFDELRLGGSAYAQAHGYVGSDVPTCTNPEYFRDAFNAVQECVRRQLLLAGHDVSAGGLITTLLEMCFANTHGGLKINLVNFETTDILKILFAENPGVVVQVATDHEAEFKHIMEEAGVAYIYIGTPARERTLRIRKGDFEQTLDIDALRDVWYAPSHRLDTKQSRNGCADQRAANYSRQPLQWQLPPHFNGTLAAYGLNPDRWRTLNAPLGSAASLREEPSTLNDKPSTLNETPSARLCRFAPRRTINDKPSSINETPSPRAAIIREKGTNGEREMAYSLYLAGFDVKDVMMTDLITGRETLDDIQMIVFCGGFSNSDVLGSAKGWAGAFLYNPKAKAALDRFYARPDTLSLGICNGCQLMVELGLLHAALPPTGGAGRGASFATMLHNDSRKFESAFLGLTIPENDSVMFRTLAGSKLGIWVAHGEGKFHLPQPEGDYHIVAKYSYHGYPANPNGSDYDVAGLCSADGHHLAMMPHLERAIFPWQCAYYPADRAADDVTPWLEAFVNARRWCEATHPHPLP